MKKINSILIDDEIANLEMIEALLTRHCPSIEIVGKAQSAEDGYTLITEKKPDLVFLDIRMPHKTGFDLLRMFERVTFNVIFVSGFDQYAVQAFEFSAVDYILKPVDYLKLIAAVNKATQRVQSRNNDDIIHFIHSLDEKNELIKSISLHQNDKVNIVELKDICFIQAARGYSEIVTENGNRFLSAKSLTDYEELLERYPSFFRANKSTIVNISYVKQYTKGPNCFITVKNHQNEIEVPRRKKSHINDFLKSRGI